MRKLVPNMASSFVCIYLSLQRLSTQSTGKIYLGNYLLFKYIQNDNALRIRYIAPPICSPIDHF